MVTLAGGACAPLLLSGQADPGLVALAAVTAASVGGNVLADVLTDGVDRLRDDGEVMGPEDLQDWLEERFTQVLEAGGEQAMVLEAQLALLLDEVGAREAVAAEAGTAGLRGNRRADPYRVEGAGRAYGRGPFKTGGPAHHR